jgi:hypothetical protein
VSDFDQVLGKARLSGDTLTSSPLEHIARARALLRGGRLSQVLYAALELRFALERITQLELIMADSATNGMLDQYQADKKVGSLRRLAPDSAMPHDIEIRDAVTGEWSKVGQYRPLDQRRVSEVYGRLGGLLHAKDGLMLGVPDREPWYRQTYEFLCETADFLEEAYRGNDQFFAYEGLDHVRLVPSEPA